MEIQKILKDNLQAPNNSLKVYEPITSLTADENMILALHANEKSLLLMKEVEYLNACKLLLISISVITGWKLPTEPLLAVLSEEFSVKMREDFLSLTPSEVKYAFRNASHVKNWGANFNLNLLDEVLTPFLNRRAEIRVLIPKNTNLLTEKRPDYQPAEFVDMYYQEFLNNEFKLDLVFEAAFDTAKKLFDIEFSEDEMLEMVLTARTHVQKTYESEMEQNTSTKKLGYYLKVKAAKQKLEALPIGRSCEDDFVNKYSKALALRKWFVAQKEACVQKIVSRER